MAIAWINALQQRAMRAIVAAVGRSCVLIVALCLGTDALVTLLFGVTMFD